MLIRASRLFARKPTFLLNRLQINRCFTTFPELAPKPEFISNAANDSGNQVVAQYKLVPVDEHPIFPGGSSAFSLTEDQYN